MKRRFLSALLMLLSLIYPAAVSSIRAVELSAFEELENRLEQILRLKDDTNRFYDFLREMRRLDGPEMVKTLSSGSVQLLEKLEKNECYSLLHAGILRPQSYFDPVDPRNEKRFANYPVFFRDFANCAIAQGWRQYSLDRKEEAFDLFCNIVKFGIFLSKKGGVSDNVYGTMICVRGIHQLEIFFNLNPDPVWKKNIQTAFKNLSRPVIDYTELLARDRKELLWIFEYIRQNIDSWKKRKDIPWLGAEATPEQKCAANQIILQAAIILKAAEFSVVKKREIENVEQLREEILKTTSLEEWPTCPAGGYYNVSSNLELSLCSIHPIDVIIDKNFTFAPMSLDMLTIVDTPELEVQEKQALDYLEALSKLSPLESDAASRAAELKQQYSCQGSKGKPNLVIKSMLRRDYSMLIRQIRQVQEEIDALM